jgi:DNA polymerase I
VIEFMRDPCPRLFLVDGSSYVFRAFFSIPRSANANGMPSNAIFGFTNMVLNLLRQHRPEYILVALDAGRQTFRHQMFAGYKGQRPGPPADLIPQLPYFRKILDALSVAFLELAGYEADDIIATVCDTMTDQGCDLIVVSNDKDLMQLVTDRITILDGVNNRWIGTDQVREKFGVAPEHVIQVMGLMGDAVDNIPGVRGIGEKTAIPLIRQFGTLENLFGCLDEVETLPLRGAARVRKLLEDSKDAAFLSRSLATVKRDVPIKVVLNDLCARVPDREKVRALFSELGFFNLLKLFEAERLG